MSSEQEIKELQKHIKNIGMEMNIMLVEDDEIIQTQIRNLLLHFFARVDTANDGVEGLELYSKRHYDLVITDLTMPYMNGIELVRNIKEVNTKQAIFVLSAHSESHKLIELINLGIDGFVLKPLVIKNLLELLAKRCQAIYDSKMSHYYSKMFDQTNHQLQETNATLDSTLNELVILKEDRKFEIEDYISAKEFLKLYINDAKAVNDAVEILEFSFNFLLLRTQNLSSEETISKLCVVLNGYVEISKNIEFFREFSEKTQVLSETIQIIRDKEILVEILLPHITLFFDELEEFRKEIFEYQHGVNLHFLLERALIHVSKIEGIVSVLIK